jgi:hypothetical protein
MSSRHSNQSSKELVKSNHELRSRVHQLEDKLGRAEKAISNAIAAATTSSPSKSTNTGNLSITASPSSLLALAESIGSPSPFRSPTTGAGSSTTQDRIESLVVSNRELRYTLNDSTTKVEKLEKESEVAKREIECHKAKIVSLLDEVDGKQLKINRLNKDLLEIQEKPLQWEIEKVRLIEEQNKEREIIIDLLNRERMNAQEDREAFEEKLEQHENELQQKHDYEISTLIKKYNEQLQQEIEKRDIAYKEQNVVLLETTTQLEKIKVELTSQKELGMHTLRVGEGSPAIEKLLSLPSTVQRQLTEGSNDPNTIKANRNKYSYFPLELQTNDYIQRFLALLDQATRKPIAKFLLGQKPNIKQYKSENKVFENLEDSTSKSLHFSVSGSEVESGSVNINRNIGQDIDEATNDTHQSTIFSLSPSGSESESENVNSIASVAGVKFAKCTIQELLAPSPSPVSLALVSDRIPTLPMETFMSIATESDTRTCHILNSLTGSHRNDKCMPVSIVDLLELYSQFKENLKFYIEIIRQLVTRSGSSATFSSEVDRIPLEAVNAMKSIITEILSMNDNDYDNDNEVDVVASHLHRVQSLYEVFEAHQMLRTARLAALGWSDNDKPKIEEEIITPSPPSLVQTISCMLDNIRFVGIASDVRQLDRLSRPLLGLLSHFKLAGSNTPDSPMYCLLHYYSRTQAWKVLLESLPVSETNDTTTNTAYSSLLNGVKDILESPILDAYPNSNIDDNSITKLIAYCKSDGLMNKVISMNTRTKQISGEILLKYLCASVGYVDVVISVANDFANIAQVDGETDAMTRAKELTYKMRQLKSNIMPIIRHAQFTVNNNFKGNLALDSTDLYEAVPILFREDGTVEKVTKKVDHLHDKRDKSKPQVCFTFRKKGSCRLGDNCKYSHVTHVESATNTESNGTIIVNNLTSQDIFGVSQLAASLVPVALTTDTTFNLKKLSQFLTANLLWELPYSPTHDPADKSENKISVDDGDYRTINHGKDGLSFASCALLCKNPKLILHAYSSLSGLTVKLPLASYHQLLSDLPNLTSIIGEQGNRACVVRNDLACMEVPAEWISQWECAQLVPTSRFTAMSLRRIYGMSIYTLFNCRIISRLDAIKACAFSIADLRQQHIYHEHLSVVTVMGADIGIKASVDDFISGILTPSRVRVQGVGMSSIRPRNPEIGMDFFSEDHHHFAPFAVWEMKNAGLDINDTKLFLSANPSELQVGGYSDHDIICHGGFSCVELCNSGAARINSYMNIQLAVLTELFKSTSTSISISSSCGDNGSSKSKSKSNGWHRDYKWCSSSYFGDWYGVTCNAKKEIVKVELRCNNLSGILPECLKLLYTLEVLDVHDNSLNGIFPYWLSEMTRLKILSCHTNYFDCGVESIEVLRMISKSLPNCKVRA